MTERERIIEEINERCFTDYPKAYPLERYGVEDMADMTPEDRESAMQINDLLDIFAQDVDCEPNLRYHQIMLGLHNIVGKVEDYFKK